MRKAQVTSALVARLAIWLLPHGFVRKIVVIIDDVVLIGLLLYFGYEMLVYLWNRRPPVQRNAALGAAFAAVQAYLAAYLPPPIEAAWRDRAPAHAAHRRRVVTGASRA